jgi:hypothetical protein
MLKKLLILAGAWSLINIPLALAATGCSINGEEVPCEELTKQFGGLFAGLGVLMIVIPIIALLGFIFWLMMIIHAASNPIENKPMWIVLLIFTGLIGAIVYYFIVKRPYSAANKPLVPPRPPLK